MKKVYIIVFYLLLFNLGCHNKRIVNYDKLYDCNLYNYFPDHGEPSLSPQDSIKLYEYLTRFESDSFINEYFYTYYHYKKVFDSNFDTSFCNSYLLDHSLGFKELKSGECRELLLSDAVVVGNIVHEKFVADPQKCYTYKAKLLLKVEQILSSSFSLKEGDIVIINEFDGILGGCAREDGMNIRSYSYDYPDFKTGDRDVFLLSKYLYEQPFYLRKIGIRNNFDDEFCRNEFRYFPLWWTMPLTDRISLIKEFFKLNKP